MTATIKPEDRSKPLQWYHDNIERERKKHIEYNKKNKPLAKLSRQRVYERNKAWVMQYKAQRGCISCGVSNPLVLEFDHRNPAEKSFTIGVRWPNISLEALQKEVAKCDVRCANCHKIRTHAQRLRKKCLMQQSAMSLDATRP